MPGPAWSHCCRKMNWLLFIGNVAQWLDRQKQPIHQETTSPLPGFICTQIFIPISFSYFHRVISKDRGFHKRGANSDIFLNSPQLYLLPFQYLFGDTCCLVERCSLDFSGSWGLTGASLNPFKALLVDSFTVKKD